MLDKVVAEIDEVVREVSKGWNGWAKTPSGDRRVRDSTRIALTHYGSRYKMTRLTAPNHTSPIDNDFYNSHI